MRRILLTGASGFLGMHAIAPLLESGFEIHAVSRRAIDYRADERLKWHHVDLLDFNETSKVVEGIGATHLLHFGWYVEHGKFWDAPENETWLEASSHLFEKFVNSGGIRAVGAGTCAEYEWGGNDRLHETKTPLKPASLYGKCKAELFARLQSSTVSSAWGRIFFLYGAGEDERRLIPYVIRSLLNNETARCTNGDKIRDFLYVKDVADAFVRLIESDCEGAFNIGSGEGTALREIVTAIGGELGKSDLLSFVQDGAGTDQPERIVADATRLHTQVGWSPQYSLDDGLRETIEWWKTK